MTASLPTTVLRLVLAAASLLLAPGGEGRVGRRIIAAVISTADL